MPRTKHDDGVVPAGKRETHRKRKRSPAVPEATSLADELVDGLRPISFDDFAGQERVVDVLRTMVRAARKSDPPRPVGHTLFTGPPGLGKTTLARCVAREAGSRLHEVTAPSMSRLADVVAALTALQPGDVLFVDEIHRMPPALEEMLYGAMEDYVARWFLDGGPKAQKMELSLAPWTLVAATTRPGMVSRPLMDRFQQVLELEPYDLPSLCLITARSARKLDLSMDGDAVTAVAQRSRDTPRVANQLLSWIRDVVQADDHAVVDEALVKNAMERCGVDSIGLDRASQRYLAYLCKQRGAVGLSTIAAHLGATEDTVADQIEPFLLRRGLVERTRTGRRVTRDGRAHVTSR